jgi:bacterial/archaeal transporter family protein
MKDWILYALISMFFAGITAVLAKFGLKEFSPEFGLLIRIAVVGILVIGNYLIFAQDTFHSEWNGIQLKPTLWLMASGATTALAWIYYYKAIKLGDVGVISTIGKGSIVVTLILSYLLLNETITPKILLGALLIAAGTLLLIWE